MSSDLTLLPAPPGEEPKAAPESTIAAKPLSPFEANFFNAFTTLLRASGFPTPSPAMLRAYEAACAQMASAMEKAIYLEAKRMCAKLQAACVVGFKEAALQDARQEFMAEELEKRIETLWTHHGQPDVGRYEKVQVPDLTNEVASA